MTNRLIPSLLAGLALLATSCGKSDSNSTAQTTPAAPSTPAWLLSAAPPDAVDVAKVKSAAKEGDTVVIHGRIGGRRDPMSAGSPIFLIMDPAIPSCADNPDDHCSMPWDYCCETQDTITTNIATIQLVDATGAPLAVDLTALGFKPLDHITAVGVIGPRPSPAVLIVNATALFHTSK